jgi:predicted nucleic acid-binding protein
MAAVSNSSPLILFGRIERLDLLRQVFDEIIIPSAVRDEVLASAATLPGAESVAGAAWITTRSIGESSEPGDPLARLGRGEREAILLAQQLGGRLAVLLDDRNGRRVARSLGLQINGSAGILIRAKERGAIESVRPELDRLLAAGLYLGDRTYQAVLAAAGEASDDALRPS